MVATRKDSAGKPKKLRFNEKLAGKGLSADGLLKKLKALQSELADLDQDDTDTKSLVPICKELINHSILLHKDKGVKAYAACCLADVLRLFVPDAPYTDQELQDIFQFFFRQLSIGLKGPNDSYYDQYFYLLESLATIKSVVLICDLPQTEDLTMTLFREFFGLVRHQVARNIEMFIVECMIAIIDETETLPHEVLETIMAQFMDKNASMDQPTYRVAVEVCKATSDRLQRNVCQYFTDNIVQHAQAENYEDLGQCHLLIRRLNAACPALLLNVIPQLEEELRVDDIQIRVIATQSLGTMFADSVGGDLEKKYHSTWTLWISKKNDRSNAVRLAFIEGCKSLLTQHRVEVKEEVEESIQSKCMDPDEKVRAAVCKMIGSLDYDTALHYVSDTLIQAIGDRTMDKKFNVREEALKSIGKLYSLAYTAIEGNDKHAIRHFGWIPSQILKSLTASLESRHVTLQVISEHIYPLPSKGDDESAWTERLLIVMQHLDRAEVTTLMRLMNLTRVRPSSFEIYVDACVNNNGGIIDENEDIVKKRLSNVIKAISVSFPDPHKAVEDLQTFADINEQRLYKLLRTCMDPVTDLKGLVKAMTEFTRRIEQSSSSILSTMLVFLRQASYWIVNTSSIPTLVKKIQKASSDTSKKGRETTSSHLMAENARLLLTTISKHVPEMHRTHLTEFAKAIADDKNPLLVECCLQALASLVKNEPKLAPSDKRTLERLIRLSRGSHPRQAKYATWILAFHEKKEELCKELVEFIEEDIQVCDANALPARLASLKEVVRFAPDAFELKSYVITEYLVNEVLMQSSRDEGDGMELDDEWAELEDLPPLAESKVLAIKICRHRCLAHATTESDEIVKSVLNMLVTLINDEGAMPDGTVDLPPVKSRLRLEAAISILHLSTVDKFVEAINPHFLSVAFMIQDVCYQVREGFLNKLLHLMTLRRLSIRFNIIPFLTAHDPADELREKAKSAVLLQVRRFSPEYRLVHWETPFIRLLHALAHHPDFGVDEERIVGMAKYIQLYLALVTSSENVSLLYHLAQKCKTVRDAESHTYSENLYVMSELAQELIKAYAKSRQWSLQSYPGKVKLPGDIFRGLPSEISRTSILKTQYLADHLVSMLLANTSSTGKEKSKAEKKPPVEKKLATKRKATAKASAIGKKRQKRPGKSRKRKDSDEDEDSSSEGHSGLEDDPISESGSEKENKTSPSPSRGTRRSARTQATKKLKSEPDVASV